MDVTNKFDERVILTIHVKIVQLKYSFESNRLSDGIKKKLIQYDSMIEVLSYLG